MGVPIPSCTLLALMYYTHLHAHTVIFARKTSLGRYVRASGYRFAGRPRPKVPEAFRGSRSRLSRSSPDATWSQYRVSRPAELVSDLCQSRASRLLFCHGFLRLVSTFPPFLTHGKPGGSSSRDPPVPSARSRTHLAPSVPPRPGTDTLIRIVYTQ